MKVTLAMGLQYEHTPKHSPSSGQSDFSAHLNPSEKVIDVEPIDVSQASSKRFPATMKTFDYLTYNIKAGLDFLPVIGTQLDMSI